MLMSVIGSLVRNRGGAVAWMGFPKKMVKSPCGHAKKRKGGNTCESSMPEHRLWKADVVRQEAGGAQFRNSLQSVNAGESRQY